MTGITGSTSLAFMADRSLVQEGVSSVSNLVMSMFVAGGTTITA